MMADLSLRNEPAEARDRQWRPRVGAGLATLALVGAGALIAPFGASAAEHAVDLGTVASYSVLGGQTVTNTGPTILSDDLGVSPGTAVTGFPPGLVGGTIHAADAHAAQAQSDLVIAYTDAAGRAPTESVSGDLVGRTLTPGVYSSSGPLALGGTLTLDAEGDPSAVFIFQAASTLITASSSDVVLLNGAQACNVFWQVGSSATLGTGSTFVGTILALTSVTVTTGTTVEGRALARNGQVSLDTDTFTTPGCDTETPTDTPPDVPTDTPPDVPTETPTDVPTDTPPDVPTETPTDVPTDTPPDVPTETPTDTPPGGATDTPTDTPTSTPDVPTATSTATPPDVLTDTPTDTSTATSIDREADGGGDTQGDTPAPPELPRTGTGSLAGGLGALSALVLGLGLLASRRARLS